MIRKQKTSVASQAEALLATTNATEEASDAGAGSPASPGTAEGMSINGNGNGDNEMARLLRRLAIRDRRVFEKKGGDHFMTGRREYWTSIAVLSALVCTMSIALAMQKLEPCCEGVELDDTLVEWSNIFMVLSTICTLTAVVLCAIFFNNSLVCCDDRDILWFTTTFPIVLPDMFQIIGIVFLLVGFVCGVVGTHDHKTGVITVEFGGLCMVFCLVLTAAVNYKFTGRVRRGRRGGEAEGPERTCCWRLKHLGDPWDEIHDWAE